MTDTQPTTDTAPATGTASPGAADRLQAGVAQLQVPEPMAAAESLLLKLGLLLPAVGGVMIIAAWWQASGTKYVSDQIPMLISGGLLGIGVILLGLGLFLRYSLTRLFRFWLARLLVEHQTQTDRIVEALAAVEQAVRADRDRT